MRRRMNRQRCSRVAGLVLALGAGWLACGPSQHTGRVLLVGVDGATPRLVEAWTEEGWLPHLAALAREGASGPLRSHYPLLSPRIWNSIATGKGPEKHGIDRWVYEDDEGQLHLYRSGDRKAHALWNIASDRGRTVGVVNWLTTHPPEEIEGVMVSDFAIPGEREAHERVATFDARGLGGAGSGVAPSPAGELLHAVHPPEWAARLERISAS